MTNALHTLIRGVVRATRNWPGPKHVYTKLYQQAAAAAGRLTSGNQSIVGIYARNTYAEGTWVPGVSDIDLTVVFRNASVHDRDRFHEGYGRLRTVFPMLGETRCSKSGTWRRGQLGDIPVTRHAIGKESAEPINCKSAMGATNVWIACGMRPRSTV